MVDLVAGEPEFHGFRQVQIQAEHAPYCSTGTEAIRWVRSGPLFKSFEGKLK
jgi:hypothetical protein